MLQFISSPIAHRRSVLMEVLYEYVTKIWLPKDYNLNSGKETGFGFPIQMPQAHHRSENCMTMGACITSAC